MWKERMDEKWQAMTPEQREKVKAEWKNRCGTRWGRHSQTDTSSSMATE
jgi:hypothetical protein